MAWYFASTARRSASSFRFWYCQIVFSRRPKADWHVIRSGSAKPNTRTSNGASAAYPSAFRRIAPRYVPGLAVFGTATRTQRG